MAAEHAINQQIAEVRQHLQKPQAGEVDTLNPQPVPIADMSIPPIMGP
jgi:hypothetical protein